MEIGDGCNRQAIGNVIAGADQWREWWIYFRSCSVVPFWRINNPRAELNFSDALCKPCLYPGRRESHNTLPFLATLQGRVDVNNCDRTTLRDQATVSFDTRFANR